MVATFKLPKIEDLHFTTFQFDSRCRYIDLGKDQKNYPTSYLPNFLAYCKKILPYVQFYKKQIAYYNCTAYAILTNKIGLILPTFPKENRHKRGAISSLVSGFISLAYKGISSFLHPKRQKALHKAVSIWKRR